MTVCQSEKHAQLYEEGTKQWSTLYGRTLTKDEYLEITQNVKEFFDVLLQWDKPKINSIEE